MIDTDAFYNTLIDRIQGLLSQRGTTRIGVITEYQPFQVQVKIFPEGYITDWIPLEALAIGAGCGVICAPNIGDVCVVEHINEDFNTPVARTRLFTDGFTSPPAQAGEVWIVHSTGSLMKLTSDGIITVSSSSKLIINTVSDVDVTAGGDVNVSAQGATLTAPVVTIEGDLEVSGGITFGTGSSGGNMSGTGNIQLTGSVSATGEVSDGAGSMAGIRTTYDGHDHDESGGGTTSTPNQQM